MRHYIAAALLGLTATACASFDKTDTAMMEACEARSYAVFFATGSDTMNSDSSATLDAVADAYEGCDLFRIEVVGYADSVGNSASNLALSEERAEATLAALNARGITADRAAIVPMGERTIIDDNEPDAFERRAVMTLVPDM